MFSFTHEITQTNKQKKNTGRLIQNEQSSTIEKKETKNKISLRNKDLKVHDFSSLQTNVVLRKTTNKPRRVREIQIQTKIHIK